MNTKGTILSILAGAVLVLGTTRAAIQEHGEHGEHGDHAEHAHQKKAEFEGDPYLLDIDPVTGKKLGRIEQQLIIEFEGRELRFASEENVKTFRKAPKRYLKAVDEKMIAQQLPHYPLETCPVSGGKLGGMGTPVDRIYKNRLVRFCCAGCLKKFEAGMGEYIAQLDKAVIAAQVKRYAAVDCPVSGKKIDSMGGPLDVVMGNRLVRLCCKGCVKRLRQDPLKYLAKLDAAGR